MLWANRFTEREIRYQHRPERDPDPHQEDQAEHQQMTEYSELAH